MGKNTHRHINASNKHRTEIPCQGPPLMTKYCTPHQTKAHAFLNEVTSTHFLPTWFDPFPSFNNQSCTYNIDVDVYLCVYMCMEP